MQEDKLYSIYWDIFEEAIYKSFKGIYYIYYTNYTMVYSKRKGAYEFGFKLEDGNFKIIIEVPLNYRYSRKTKPSYDLNLTELDIVDNLQKMIEEYHANTDIPYCNCQGEKCEKK